MKQGLTALFAGVVVSSAGAAVVSVSGDATLVAPPPSTDTGDLVSLTTTHVFNEQSNVMWGGPVDVVDYMPTGIAFDITVPDRFIQPTLVDSHMIHFDVTGTSTDTTLTGTVTFDKPIHAVIFDDEKLDRSDRPLGAAGTAYPFGDFNRGFANADDQVILVDAYTLWFKVRNHNTPDQIRVLTDATVPAPASAGLFGLGVLAASRRRR